MKKRRMDIIKLGLVEMRYSFREAIDQAFKKWEAASSFKFKQVPENANPDIIVTFKEETEALNTGIQ